MYTLVRPAADISAGGLVFGSCTSLRPCVRPLYCGAHALVRAVMRGKGHCLQGIVVMSCFMYVLRSLCHPAVV